jgi:tricorn protease-like protein
MNIYRQSLLSQGLTANELRNGSDEENYYGLLLNKEGKPIIAMEGGSMYLSKRMALKIHENDHTTVLSAK